jgi:carbon-monoxide dehydrogenase medium subunit
MADLVDHADLKAAYPALTDAAGFVGGPAIRNRATLGGNLCNASPAADTATPLLALRAELDVVGNAGKRSLPISGFWRGPGQTALAPDEVLTAIRLPARPQHSGNAFQRVTRTAMDIAIANAAVDLAVDDAGRLVQIAIAIGAAGPTVLSVPGVEQALRGKAIDAAALDWIAAHVAEAARPRDDVRGSAAYRKDQCGVLAKRAVRRALHRATGREVPV